MRCGNCCLQPGEVRLADGEAELISDFLGTDIRAFTERYTCLRSDRLGLSLIERPDGACIFLEELGAVCAIHAAKPRQCRDFPSGWEYQDMPSVCEAARQALNR